MTSHKAADYKFLHRKLAEGDLYFVRYDGTSPEKIEARFRVNGLEPEIWRAIEGTAKPLSYCVEGKDTVVPLDIGAEDAFFILFRNPSSASGRAVKASPLHAVATLSQPWSVKFQPGRGAPAQVEMASLTPLEKNADADIRYFSGTATYSSRFALPSGVKRGTPLWLDLGKVSDVAEVRVNGQLAGISWFAPYRLDIGRYARSGNNSIEVKGANLWVNRLIGDKQPGARKITFTASPTYMPDAPLRPSGLIEPVQLLTE